MFDVSLSELMVIGVVALVVIGPERLPRVARTLGHLLGKLQRYVGQVKADINREMQLDDLKKFQEQMADEANKIKSSFTEVGDEIRGVETALNASDIDGVSSSATAKSASLAGSPGSAVVSEALVSSAPTGENAALPPINQSLLDAGGGRESAPLTEPPMDADDWKLPEPLPEFAEPAKTTPSAMEKS